MLLEPKSAASVQSINSQSTWIRSCQAKYQLINGVLTVRLVTQASSVTAERKLSEYTRCPSKYRQETGVEPIDDVTSVLRRLPLLTSGGSVMANSEKCPPSFALIGWTIEPYITIRVGLGEKYYMRQYFTYLWAVANRFQSFVTHFVVADLISQNCFSFFI
jgi:hypothetical protein